MNHNPQPIEIIRRVISVLIVMGGLYALLLLAFPFAQVPGHLVALVGEHNPIAGTILAGIALVGFFMLTMRVREILDTAFGGAYRLVRIIL
ncbi:hypothetical protein [Agrobacterium tumefaciens]|uniref:hypothetical protein n=1 Tax=Agrobacterium tumefaciens TaxID=358 RepID=UPI0022438E37|nr:hypothetical protein [Agrobacterium tumefaciens]MCW8060422.1 hypothetical protein [Agrobacterium tumefaciens]MCW8145866.1 hypothetical protein [Agrobacterium tumefaciens]